MVKDKHLEDLLLVNKLGYYKGFTEMTIKVVFPMIAHALRELNLQADFKGKPLPPGWGKFKRT